MKLNPCHIRANQEDNVLPGDSTHVSLMQYVQLEVRSDGI